MMSPSCEELLALIPAYAIGATDAEETRLIEAKLATCPELAAEVAAFRAVDGALAAGAPQAAPPADLLPSLLAAAHRTRKRVLPVGRYAYVAAVVALMVFALGSNLFWLGRIAGFEERLVVADSAHLISLPTAINGAATNARGQVIWLPDADTGLLLAANFPSQAEATVYQAWVTRAGIITSLGTFVVNTDGSASLTFPVALLAESFDALGVTLEPGSGSDQPTSAPVVRWQRQV